MEGVEETQPMANFMDGNLNQVSLDMESGNKQYLAHIPSISKRVGSSPTPGDSLVMNPDGIRLLFKRSSIWDRKVRSATANAAPDKEYVKGFIVAHPSGTDILVVDISVEELVVVSNNSFQGEFDAEGEDASVEDSKLRESYDQHFSEIPGVEGVSWCTYLIIKLLSWNITTLHSHILMNDVKVYIDRDICPGLDCRGRRIQGVSLSKLDKSSWGFIRGAQLIFRFAFLQFWCESQAQLEDCKERTENETSRARDKHDRLRSF